METTDALEPQSPNLQITENAKSYLKSTSTWTSFFAVICFISIAIIILSGITILISGSFLSGINEFSYLGANDILSFTFILIGIFYIVLGVIMIFPALYLSRYAKCITRALAENDSLTLENAMQNMKSFWKFSGIFTIVYISLCIIAVPIVIWISVAMM